MAVSYYNAGTASLTSGSTAMIGLGTLWVGNVRPGDQVVGYFGQTAIVETVNSNTSITLTRAFRGTSQTTAFPYEIIYAPADASVAQDVNTVLNAIRAGTMVGLSSLPPSSRKLPYLDATATAALTDLSDEARTLLARTDIKADNLAPIHVGDRDISNSVDAQVLISRTIGTGTGNSHAFSDSSLFSRNGYAYNSYDARINFSGANFDHYCAFQSAPTLSFTGTMDNLTGCYSGFRTASGVLNSYMGVWVDDATGAGAITTTYGVYIAPLSKAAKNWAVYTEGATPSRFGGIVGIGADPEAGYALLVKGATVGGKVLIKGATDGAGVTGMEVATGASSSYVWQYGNVPFSLGTNNIERLRIAASGEITMPAQPAFHAVGGLAVTGIAVVDFSTALLNRGSVFNTANGRFTAPVAGAYSFTTNVLANPAANTEIAFYKNGVIVSNIGRGNAKTNADEFATISITAVLQLAANDYVQVYAANASASVYQNYRNFSGFLVG